MTYRSSVTSRRRPGGGDAPPTPSELRPGAAPGYHECGSGSAVFPHVPASHGHRPEDNLCQRGLERGGDEGSVEGVQDGARAHEREGDASQRQDRADLWVAISQERSNQAVNLGAGGGHPCGESE